MEPVSNSFLFGVLLQRGIEKRVVTEGRNGRNSGTFLRYGNDPIEVKLGCGRGRFHGAMFLSY